MVGGVGLTVGAVEAGRKGWALYEQHETWAEASRPNDEFLARHARDLSRLTLGASFAPEQWRLDAESQHDALDALALVIGELGLRQLRLGIRWRRAVGANGVIDLTAYAPYIERCLESGATVCLNVGPIRTFRWPEEHVPDAVLDSLPRVPAKGASIGPDDPLAVAALDYLDRLLDRLRTEYGPTAFASIQVENEPFYRFPPRDWRLSPSYLQQVARHIDAAYPDADLLVTSAGRLDLRAIRELFAALTASEPRFAGRLVSGFDFHYQTPYRDSLPVVRYFDQIAYARPFTATPEQNLRWARADGYRIEVTEGQAEPYGHLQEPGNSAKHLRFLLLRCLDRVLDPRAPALIRLWGAEELAKKRQRHELTSEHRAIIELLQAVNAGSGEGESARR